jgi:hypothetical protein
MKTEKALVLAGNGFRNVSALARILGITRQGVQNFKEFLPKKRIDDLKKLKPEWFRKSRSE